MTLLKQIRMGNFINEVSDHPTKVGEKVYELRKVNLSVFKDMCAEKDQSKYASVELTEEWMEKFGFKKNPKGEWNKEIKNMDKSIILVFKYDTQRNMFIFPYNMFRTRYLKSVHDLQNFFFAHWEQELTIKENT
jgi:hypothetical protein